MDDSAGDKGSIGNYKGVMLCNRPPEAGAKPANEGNKNFISRVTVKEALGLNPTTQLPPRTRAPRRNLEILSRHKKWLADLAAQKSKYQQLIDEENIAAEDRKLKVTAKEASRRKELLTKAKEEKNYKEVMKTMTKKVSPEEMEASRPAAKPQPSPPRQEQEDSPPPPKPVKLTEKNLQKHVKAKPKWAMTEEQQEEAEEEEVEDLLKFAYELDYETFIDDFQVRQALEIVKERVKEMKQDDTWKQKVVEKYNQSERSSQAPSQAGSIKSYESAARARVAREADKRSEWDSSTVCGDDKRINEEDRVAKLVADSVLENNPQFKGVHSNQSIRKMLEREAKKQLQETAPKAAIP